MRPDSCPGAPERAREFVAVLAIGDDDRHLPSEAGQLVVPESGTTVTVIVGTPFVMVPRMKCRSNAQRHIEERHRTSNPSNTKPVLISRLRSTLSSTMSPAGVHASGELTGLRHSIPKVCEL